MNKEAVSQGTLFGVNVIDENGDRFNLKFAGIDGIGTFLDSHPETTLISGPIELREPLICVDILVRHGKGAFYEAEGYL